MTDQELKRKVAAILDKHGITTGQVHIERLIVVHNYNNTKYTISVGWGGYIVTRYRTPDRGDLLKHRTRREFFIVD